MFVPLFLRIYLNYHTSKQVIFGDIAGILIAVAWYTLIENILRPLGVFNLIVNSEIAKYFYLRDSSEIENIARMEYMIGMELRKKKNHDQKRLSKLLKEIK